MKNFEEKEIKDLSLVSGGIKDPKITISFTVDLGNLFNFSNSWFDGNKENNNADEFDLPAHII